jgi:hypothetical protein
MEDAMTKNERNLLLVVAKVLFEMVCWGSVDPKNRFKVLKAIEEVEKE